MNATIAILCIIIVVLLSIIGYLSIKLNDTPTSVSLLVNGNPFPYASIGITNSTGLHLTQVVINDSLGFSYLVSSWNTNGMISLALPIFNNFDHLDIYASDGESSMMTVQMVNVNQTIVFQYLYGTAPTSFTFQTVTPSSDDIQPVYNTSNYKYLVTSPVLVNGDPFPDSILLYNNTLSSQSVEPLTITSFYITDSGRNTYLNTNTNTSITEKMNINANLLIQFIYPILPFQYVQINMQDTNHESHDIVLYNHHHSVIITYSANVDPSAFVLSKTMVQKRQPCHSEFVNSSPSIWPNGSVLKVGFLDGEEWQQAYVGYIVQKYLTPLVNLTFQFTLGQISDSDTSYQIRISFDENKGSYSLTGTKSAEIHYHPNSTIPIRPQPASMNFGWTDAPVQYPFLFHGKRYTTPSEFPQGGYGFMDSNGNAYGTTILHQFGHALGMSHEHSTPFGHSFRYDKEAVYEELRMNKWTKEAIETQVVSLEVKKENDFDYFSIMKYTIDTLQLEPPVSADMELWATTANYSFSPCDMAYLANAYPGKMITATCSKADHRVPVHPVVITN